MSLYMEQTTIDSVRTAAEVEALLIEAGAVGVHKECEGGKIVGLVFVLRIHDLDLPFRLPVRTEAVFRVLQTRRSTATRVKPDAIRRDREQAERVAWRQVLRWIQAQFAMIDVGMVQAAEVFMPYGALPNGRTMFEQYASTCFRALPGPEVRT